MVLILSLNLLYINYYSMIKLLLTNNYSDGIKRFYNMVLTLDLSYKVFKQTAFSINDINSYY